MTTRPLDASAVHVSLISDVQKQHSFTFDVVVPQADRIVHRIRSIERLRLRNGLVTGRAPQRCDGQERGGYENRYQTDHPGNIVRLRAMRYCCP